MKPFLGVARSVTLVALVASAHACSSATGLDRLRFDADASRPDGARRLPAGNGGAPNDAAVVPAPEASTGGVRPPRVADAAPAVHAASDGSSPDASVEGGPRDAASDADARDGATADALQAPDCTCPPLDFYLDATFGASALHLTTPYTLQIYCPETAVQIAHPQCGEVYRLSACNGSPDVPPCFYMGVDLSRGLLLGNFRDASGRDWDVTDGTIAPDPPVGRIGTGTFSASLSLRGGNLTSTLSGTFHACVTRMPACEN